MTIAMCYSVCCTSRCERARNSTHVVPCALMLAALKRAERELTPGLVLITRTISTSDVSIYKRALTRVVAPETKRDHSERTRARRAKGEPSEKEKNRRRERE